MLGLTLSGGLFVSFMSGDTAHLSMALAGDLRGALRPAVVVASFLTGVVVGELVAGPPERPRRTLVLAIEAAVLAAACVCAGLRGPAVATACVMALAMGMQNASIHEAGGVSLAVTYVTGTYVQMGRRLANALAGRGSWRGALPYAGLILALAAGAVAGALAMRVSGVGAIAAAAAAAASCAVVATRLPAGDRSAQAG